MTTIDMQDIKDHYRHGTGHWFDPETLRFFRGRLPQTAFTTADGLLSYFVSSEQFDRKSKRLYTVREYDWRTREINTIGDFQQYNNPTTAVRAAKRLAQNSCALAR